MSALTQNNLLPQAIPEINKAHELFFGINRPAEPKQAVQIYKQLAAQNNTSALTMLGALYSQGKHVQKDVSSAVDCYLKILKLNSEYQGEAFYRIGELVDQGILQFPVKFELPDVTEITKEMFILKCFEKAAEFEHLDAMTDVAGMYEHGSERLQKDLGKAEQWYQSAVKQDFPRALNNFGKMLLQEKTQFSTVKESYEVKAVECFQKAHELGYTKGTFNLGICYERGYYFQKNIEKAKLLFKMAGEKGDIDAKMFYASYLLKDAVANGSEDQYLQAADLLQEIIKCDPNKLDALYYIGYLYENGFGVGQDSKLALQYYQKAAFACPAHALSLNKLGDIYNTGNEFVQQDRRIAFKYYKQAASLNNKKALASLTFHRQMHAEGFKDNSLDENYLNQLLQNQQPIEKGKQDVQGFINNLIQYDTKRNMKQ